MNNDRLEELISTIVSEHFPHQTGNLPNSKEWMEVNRKLFEHPDDDPWARLVENRWQKHSKAQNDEELNIDRKKLLSVFNNSIERFIVDFKCARYSEPETMLTIYNAFEIYFLAEGRLTLDQVFFGNPTKRIGNYSSRRSKTTVYQNFHFNFKFPSNKKKFGSLERFAEHYLSNVLTMESQLYGKDVDTFLKGYRRWKNNLKLEDK